MLRLPPPLVALIAARHVSASVGISRGSEGATDFSRKCSRRISNRFPRKILAAGSAIKLIYLLRHVRRAHPHSREPGR